jgi:RimJ/RimL family protein N-acetyltransferase
MRAPTLTDHEHPDAITLRPHRAEDVDAVLAMCSDPAVQRWTTVPVPYERAHAERFVGERPSRWADDTGWELVVEAADDQGRPRFAGQVGLRPNRCGGADLGFALAPWARGRGVMSRAVRLLLAWGFAGGLQVVHWQAHVGNWSSRRIAWACGFAVEGSVRGLLAQRGELRDAWVGSLVRGEPMAPRSSWLEPVELLGAGVRLRRWRADDVPRVAQACADERTQQWLPQLPSPYSLADAQWYLRSREDEHATGAGVYWCVADPDDDRCLGSLGLMHLAAGDPEIGYWAHPDARGAGVMTEATRLAVRHALLPVDVGGLGRERVVVRAAAGNAASNRVALAAGMGRYGLARRAERLRDGTVDDFVLYEALADELRPR